MFRSRVISFFVLNFEPNQHEKKYRFERKINAKGQISTLGLDYSISLGTLIILFTSAKCYINIFFYFIFLSLLLLLSNKVIKREKKCFDF